jgi:hypothetical protein
MNSKTLLLALVAAALAGGCRSDGGFDRRDNGIDFDFTMRALGRQTQRDAEQTWENVVNIPAAVGRSFENAGRAISSTCSLYLETRIDR